MDKYGRVYFDHEELIPDIDKERYEDAIKEERNKEIERRLKRIMKEEQEVLDKLHDR